MSEKIEINYVFDEDKISRMSGGAYQVIINGKLLSKDINEEKMDKGKRFGYSGDYLYVDLYKLLEATVEVSENLELYEKHTVKFESFRDFILLEYLGDDKIRVGYRIFEQNSEKESYYCADPPSACGYVVNVKKWIEALEKTVKNYQEDLRKFDTRDSADWFDSELDKLENIKQRY